MYKMASFDFQTAGKILFGRGKAETVPDLIANRGKRVLLVRGRQVAWVDHLFNLLVKSGLEVIDFKSQGEPSLSSVRAIAALGREARVDQVLAIGGGSVIDLGKAAAAVIPCKGDIEDYLQGKYLEFNPLHFTALPTTAGTGAEVTKNAVITVPDSQLKLSLRDDRMIPKLAIIDPALTDHTPKPVTLASGMDAITQVVEPFLSRRANPLTDAICQDAIKVGLPALVKLAAGEDASARDQMAYVSLAGGIALANAGLGAVHGFAAVIGGRTNAPHGLICARLLGPAMKANAQINQRAGSSMAKYDFIARSLSEAMGLSAENTFDELGSWLTDQSLPGLSAWITQPQNILETCEAARTASSMKTNPYDLSLEQLEELLLSAL